MTNLRGQTQRFGELTDIKTLGHSARTLQPILNSRQLTRLPGVPSQFAGLRRIAEHNVHNIAPNMAVVKSTLPIH